MKLTNQQALRRATADLALNKPSLDKESKDEAVKGLSAVLPLSPVNKTSVSIARTFLFTNAGFDDYGKAAVYLAARFLSYARADLRSYRPTDRGPTLPGSPVAVAA